MEIKVTVESNGIHSLAIIDLSNATSDEMELAKKILEVAEKYNKKQVENA